MSLRILTIIVALASASFSSLGQTGFSESRPYKPRVDVSDKSDKSDKKKKSNKNKDSAPITPTPAPTSTPAPVPIVVPLDEDVIVPISVFDKSGTFVGGITKEDVAIYVDGTEIPVAGFTQEKEPPTVILVIDSSPSAQFGIEEIRKQAWTLVETLPPNAKVIVMEFNVSLRVLSQASASRAETKAALAKTQVGDGTSLYSTIATLCRDVVARVPGRKVIALLTDGVDTTSKTFTFASSLYEVEKQNVPIYPFYLDTQKDYGRRMIKGARRTQMDDMIRVILGANNLPSQSGPLGSADADYKKGLEYLDDLSVASGGRMFKSDQFENATKSFVSELSSRYYATIRVQKNGTGSREIRVRVSRPELTVYARGSFIDQ